MKRQSIRDEIMLAVPAAGNEGLTRDEVITQVLWQMGAPCGDGLTGIPKRASVRDRLQRMIKAEEIELWCDGGITQIA